MESGIRHFLSRVTQAFWGALRAVGVFAVPAIESGLGSLGQLGSRQWRDVVWRFGRYGLKALIRGVVPAVALGLAAGWGAKLLGEAGGTLGRPILEWFVLKTVVRDALPLVVGLLLALRQGAALTAKYAYSWAEGPARQDDDELRRSIAPYLLASVVAGVAFFAVVAWLTLYGYLVGGPLARVPDLSTWDALLSPALRTAWFVGLGKAAGFGFVIGYVALALGWSARVEHLRDSPRARGHAPHYYIWEAASLSLAVCVGLTVALARPLGTISL